VDARLRISRRSGWARYRIVLDGGDAQGDGSSPEREVELIAQVQAAQANQPGVRR